MRAMRERGGGGGQRHVGGDKNPPSVRAKLFRSVIYCTNPRPDTKSWVPIRIPVTCQWEGGFCGSCGSTTVRPQFRYIRWTNHVHVKWVTWFFLPWVDSKLQVRLEPPSWAFHTLKGETEKMFPLLVAFITVFILIFILSTIQELFHWLIIVGIHISISKSEPNDGVSLDFP